jgi:hypothetical protein
VSSARSLTLFDLRGCFVRTFFFGFVLALAVAAPFLAFALDFAGTAVALGLGMGLGMGMGTGMGMGLGLLAAANTFLVYFFFPTDAVVSFPLTFALVPVAAFLGLDASLVARSSSSRSQSTSLSSSGN